MTLSTVILSSAIVIVAFLVRGLTGFGAGLIMVPLFLLFLDIELVVPVSAVLNVLSAIILLSTFQTKRWIRKDLLPLLITGAVIGVILGTYALTLFSGDVLKKLCGLLIAGYALRKLFRGKGGDKNPRNYVGFIAGLLSGFLNGMFGAGGPPVVIYLSHCTKDKRAFRATAALFLLVVSTWQLVTLSYARLADWRVLQFVLYLLPAFTIGSLAGSALHVRVDQRLFGTIIALLLLLSGALLVY